MNDQMQREILARLDAVAQKLGVATSALFQLYMRQAYIDGVECFLLAALAVFGAYRLFKILPGIRKRDDFDSDIHTGLTLIGITVLVIAAAVFLCSSADNIANPQLAAFKSLMETIKPK